MRRRDEDGWSLLSLRAYLDVQIRLILADLTGLHAAIDRLISKLDAQLPREVYDRQHVELVERTTRLERWRANLAGRTAIILAAAGIASATIGAVIGHLLS